jgi:hypothetical protein
MHRPTPRPKNARRATGLLRHRMMAGRRPVLTRPARPKPPPCPRGSRPGRTACRIAGDVGAAVAARLISMRQVRSIRRRERPRPQPLRRAPRAIPAPPKRAARKADRSGRCCACAVGVGTAARARCRGSARPRPAAERLRRPAQPKARLRPKARRQRVARRRLAIVRTFGHAVAGGVPAFQSPGRHRGKPVKR